MFAQIDATQSNGANKKEICIGKCRINTKTMQWCITSLASNVKC